VVLWSDEVQEHFMMYNSMSKKGKIKRKCVLTNAFSNLPAPKKSVQLNTIKLAYQEYFNTNDVFNHYHVADISHFPADRAGNPIIPTSSSLPIR